ncbi:MAG: HNH endonuclease [Gammaproteobacteria bacterium]
MPFPHSVREEALVKAKRRCCVCHEFAGRSINVHHIKQEADGGANTLDNAIVLCLRCHAEAGHFNPKHPLGTKYAPSELIKHRDAWFEACEHGNIQDTSTVEVKVKRTYTTSDLHKYILLFTFHNGNENAVSGWKLDVLVPYLFKVSTVEFDTYHDVNVDGKRYNKLQTAGSDVLYLGESVELT